MVWTIARTPGSSYEWRVFEHPIPVRWNDVDAAGIVYFPQFLDYCHLAIEALFTALPGGYPALTMQRRIGVPSVHLEADFRAPLRYGDTCLVRLHVARLGRSSVTFRHVLVRARDGVVCAEIVQVVALSDLDALRAVEIPADVRALLESHLEHRG
jgi:4-hydroxybenzoyl-CoA thioesterase